MRRTAACFAIFLAVYAALLTGSAGAAPNLAPNSNFELDPSTSYLTNGTGTFSWATDQSHSATHSLKIVSTTATLKRWMSKTNAIAATPGTQYTACVYLKTQSVGANAAYLSVNFWNASQVYIPATVDSTTKLSGTNDWTQVCRTTTSPAGTAYIRVEFRLTSPGTLWADDVSVEVGPGGPACQAPPPGAITFEPPYTPGDINGQQGWLKTGPYDVAVESDSSYGNIAVFCFGTQALRLSNAVTSGSFGDQTFSPGVANPAGESTGRNHFDASFSIGSTQATQQPGLFTSVSPDDGSGGRMSYVGFDDQADGIHVIFYDVTDPGPVGTPAVFNPTDVVTIDRTHPHSIKFSIDFVPGPGNDVVKLFVDGVLEITGTSWENYYRYDPEQTGSGNVVPTTSKLLFREGGTAVPANADKGYLVDNVLLASSNVASACQAPPPGAITFEPPYTPGDINGQQGWLKTGPYDVAVESDSSYGNIAVFCFGTQALRLSNAVTSGSFGDQTFSPGVANPAGESTGRNHFDASFSIGSTQATQQPGLFTSVSPDDGSGGRMSYVGFDDQADGIHVIFYDVTDPGPVGTPAVFNPTDVVTIDRTHPHSIKFAIDFVPGPGNDVVKLFVDGVLEITGTSWENYYRYDPEQTGSGNVVPTTSKLLFREGGTAVPANADKGYLVDNVLLASSNVVSAPNLAPNPNFELDPSTSYLTNGTGTFSWATDQSHSATHSLKIVSTTATLKRWMSKTNAIAATPGTQYTACVYLKTQSVGANAAYLSVNFWNASQVYIPATVDSTTKLSGTNDWTQVCRTTTSPAGTAYIRVEFRLTSPGTLWADDVSVTTP